MSKEDSTGTLALLIGGALLVITLTAKKDIVQKTLSDLNLSDTIYYTVDGVTKTIKNRSKLDNQQAAAVIEGTLEFAESAKGVISNVGDLGDAVRVAAEDLPAYIENLEETVKDAVEHTAAKVIDPDSDLGRAIKDAYTDPRRASDAVSEKTQIAVETVIETVKTVTDPLSKGKATDFVSKATGAIKEQTKKVMGRVGVFVR